MNSGFASQAIRIVEYEHSYAPAVARMWNLSNESWGGGHGQRTAESVMQDMDNSVNLHVFLAVDGDEVVGFCSFSHYMLDEGALYVPLLNVRPDYHNRKVGKALILNAVAKTVELGWPRLDLFTWSGNTKAVPMYKKCGFFWEKKDDGVHLMNFIPTVLQTEALKPYLDTLDWYADSTRTIEIKPDGVPLNGFDLFSYCWNKNGQELRVDFEKTGRGIHTLDTPDYEIRTEVEAHDLVFGRTYPVRYHIRSKTGEPVVCHIKGRDNKNIRFDLNETITVTDTAVIEGTFHVEPVHEEQSDWKTHPAVVSQWQINGRNAELGTGIAPKFPAKVTMAGVTEEQFIGTPETLYLNVESQLPEAAEFRLLLPAASFIRFAQPEVTVRVSGLGRASVPVSYTLEGYGVYSPVASVEARTDSGEALLFQRTLSMVFRGVNSRFSGEDLKFGYAVNGANVVVANKQNNELFIRRNHMEGSFFWSYPRLGKPYSSEFVQRKAESIRYEQDGDTQVMEVSYLSEDFPGIAFKAVARIEACGLVEHYYIVENHSGEATPDTLRLQECFRFEFSRIVLPYDGAFLDLEEEHANHVSHWELSRVSENWLFNRGKKLSLGLTWDPGRSLMKCERFYGLEHPLGGLPAGQTIRTSSTWVAINVFAEWQEFRSYARKQREQNIPALTDHLELRINGGNPFVRGRYEAEIIDRKLAPLSGRLSLTGLNREFTSFQPGAEDNKHSLQAEGIAPPSGETDIIRFDYDGNDVRLTRSAAVFGLSSRPVTMERLEHPKGELLTISNGKLTLSAAPAFGGAVHSLTYNGREWLDSSYPTPGPRSWWNPWLGGLGLDLQGMAPFSLHQEAQHGDFAALADTLGNVWSGMRLTMQVEQHEGNRGLTVEQYYLLLPGAPVLAKVNRISNRTGLSHSRFMIMDRGFWKPGTAGHHTGWMEIPEGIRYRMGTNEDEIAVRGRLRFGSDLHAEAVHIAFDPSAATGFAYTNNLLFTQGVAHHPALPDGACQWTKPVFHIFGNHLFAPAELASLSRLRFEFDGNKEE